jgi:hypothetical protein
MKWTTEKGTKMKRDIPISCEEYTIQISKWSNNVFRAQCVEIPICCADSELEGEALVHCREFIQGYINFCLSKGFSYPEPNESSDPPTMIDFICGGMFQLYECWKEEK